MPRESDLLLADMLAAAGHLVESFSGLKYEDFIANRTFRLAAERDLEIIGEAAKAVPDVIKEELSHLDWRSMARMRDVISHHYFDLDYTVVWNIIQDLAPQLVTALTAYRQDKQ